MSELIVSLHDVAPSKAEMCRRWLEVLDARNITATLLVVPGQWNAMSLDSSPAFIEWLHAAHTRGHEIALHGLHHTSDRKYQTTLRRKVVGTVLARGCEEFWHLPYEEAHRRIQLGREKLHHFGFAPNGFVAPGWLMSPGTLEALRDLGFLYTTTHTHFCDLNSSTEIFMPALSQRPQSLWTKAGVGINHAAASVMRVRKAPIRIAIHPNDVVNQLVRNANISTIDRLVGHGYESKTYIQKYWEINHLQELNLGYQAN
jgi:predicted deacetylase